jgi:tetratricopeptide (TPR) repeat protein
MIAKEINNVYRRIIEALNGDALKTAFEWTQTLISGTQLFSFQRKLDELQDTYHYMLGYYLEGSEDPMQQQIYAGIRTGTYELADHVRFIALMADSPAQYYASARVATESPTNIDGLLNDLQRQYDIDDLDKYGESNRQLFMSLWTTPFLADDDAAAVARAIKSDTMPLVTKCQIVSALLLALQEYFDIKKMYLLFDAAGRDEDEVRLRAYINIYITLDTYRDRTNYYPGIAHRLELLAEAPDFKRILQTICLRFIITRETEKVSLRLRKDILPEIMKFTAKHNREFGLPDFSESDPDDMNPEWAEILEGSPLARKIEEYSHLQEEGVDVMHSTFIELKYFPYFRSVDNWFMPFMYKQSIFASQSAVRPELIELLRQASFICNSDKYSFFLSLFNMPERHRSMITAQLDAQLLAINEQNKAELKSTHNRVEIITGQYVQDLFRFYKLYAGRREFTDPFDASPEFHNLPILKPFLSDAETLTNIAELYLRKNYFENALSIYEQLIAQEPGDEMVYQKLGYCKQMSDDLPGALDSYLRSEILNPNSKWLVRRIGNCYKSMQQPAKALEFYLRYEKMTPDNPQALTLIGHCHIDLHDYAEALKYYFKASYIDPDNLKVWRAIAWCSFLSGKYGQAQNYYRRILDKAPQTQDFLNAGHTECVLKNRKEMLRLYSQAIREEGGDLAKFLPAYIEDIPELIRAGVKASEIPLVMDQLRYTFGEIES